MEVKLTTTEKFSTYTQKSNHQVYHQKHLRFCEMTARKQAIIFSKVDVPHDEPSSSRAILHTPRLHCSFSKHYNGHS